MFQLQQLLLQPAASSERMDRGGYMSVCFLPSSGGCCTTDAAPFCSVSSPVTGFSMCWPLRQECWFYPVLLKATEFVCYNLTTPLLHLRHLSLVFSPFLLLFPPIHPPSDVSMRGTLRHVCILRRVLCVCVWNYSYPTCCNFKRKDLVVHSSLHALTSLPRGLFFFLFLVLVFVCFLVV